ncbi:hypothetical protein SeMB42_g03424 [Synchytrium endobioticum]|uniref:Uncharacterized protein n=1 Tax=Synchytrium endobioticum TaxID=286115 RepID=A0A507D8K1_9FUNG|nr:hypothetical protein SeLEV6574_g04154 [Synchytrium endobioticum]TPX47170.1 hypothetical protein SeMB42_g03424 [Synchytrium endobioticum]
MVTTETSSVETTITSPVQKVSLVARQIDRDIANCDTSPSAIAAGVAVVDTKPSTADSADGNSSAAQGPALMATAQDDSSATAPSTTRYSIEDVPRLLAEGKKKAALSDWDASLDVLSTAVELMNEKYGELASECADAYFIYGQTLLTAAVSRANALGGIVTAAVEPDRQQDDKILESVQKPASRFVIEGDDADWDEEDEGADEDVAEGETEESGEPALPSSELPEASSSTEAVVPEKDDMELAFEVLDMCRVIYSKTDNPETMAKLGDVHLMLGDIALDGGHYKEAIKDYVLAISLKQSLNAPQRELAEAHYKLALPLEYEAQYDEAIKHVNAVVECLSSRISLLKQQLKDAGISVDEKGKGKLSDPVDDSEPVKSEIAEMEAVLVEMNEKIHDLTRQKAQLRPGFLNASNEETLGSSDTNSGTTSTEQAVVHDLSASGLVKSRKSVTSGDENTSTISPSAATPGDSAAMKRKNQETAVEGTEAKKFKMDSTQ